MTNLWTVLLHSGDDKRIEQWWRDSLARNMQMMYENTIVILKNCAHLLVYMVVTES